MTYYERNKERLKAYASARWFRMKASRTEIKLKGFVNYNIHNFCAPCGVRYSKDIHYCPDCHHRIRTKAWANPRLEPERHRY